MIVTVCVPIAAPSAVALIENLYVPWGVLGGTWMFTWTPTLLGAESGPAVCGESVTHDAAAGAGEATVVVTANEPTDPKVLATRPAIDCGRVSIPLVAVLPGPASDAIDA